MKYEERSTKTLREGEIMSKRSLFHFPEIVLLFGPVVALLIAMAVPTLAIERLAPKRFLRLEELP